MAGQHDHAHGVVTVQLAEGGAEVGDEVFVHRVVQLGAVHPDGGHLAAAGDFQSAVVHLKTLSFFACRRHRKTWFLATKPTKAHEKIKANCRPGLVDDSLGAIGPLPLFRVVSCCFVLFRVFRGRQVCACPWLNKNYMRNTPKRVLSTGADRLASSARLSTSRVCAGSITPSSHSRALA